MRRVGCLRLIRVGVGTGGRTRTGRYLGGPAWFLAGTPRCRSTGSTIGCLAPDSVSLSPTGAVSVETWVNGSSFASSPGGFRTVVLKGGSYWLRVDNVGGVQRARFFIRDGSATTG